MGCRAGVRRLALLRALAAAAFVTASGGAIVAAILAPSYATGSASQAWPAFVLVAGLLIIGALAAEDGLFAAVGAQVARLPGSATRLLVLLLLFEACVTAVLNLDTAVVFLTPLFVHAERQRRTDEAAFLYGAVFMANSASLLLPGSNLTNLIVLRDERVPGHLFAARMLPAWIVAVLVTTLVLALLQRRSASDDRDVLLELPRVRLGYGAIGVAIAAVLVLTLQQPALPVLGSALVLAVLGRLRVPTALEAANPLLLFGFFTLAVALGTAARGIESLSDLTHTIGRWPTAGIGAAGALLVNNLPAAVVLSAHAPAHPRALLIGLDLGPNLAVTGSLSAALWWQVARRHGARPSALSYTLLGIVIAPAAMALALVVSRLFGL